jgi:acyl carrier protein
MENILEQLISLASEESGKEEVSAESTFEYLELDSLELMNFVVSTEQKFGVKIQDKEIPALNTIGDLAKLVENKVSA